MVIKLSNNSRSISAIAQFDTLLFYIYSWYHYYLWSFRMRQQRVSENMVLVLVVPEGSMEL